MMPMPKLVDLTRRALQGDELSMVEYYEVLKDPRVGIEATLQVCGSLALHACGLKPGHAEVVLAVVVSPVDGPFRPGFQPVSLRFVSDGRKAFVQGFVSKEC